MSTVKEVPNLINVGSDASQTPLPLEAVSMPVPAAMAIVIAPIVTAQAGSGIFGEQSASHDGFNLTDNTAQIGFGLAGSNFYSNDMNGVPGLF